jgi:hypothetical protein
MYCGRPLSGDHDGWAHAACSRVVEADDKANEVRSSAPMEEAEREVRSAGRCPWQIDPGYLRSTYCGREIGDSGADEPDGYCAEHQCEAWGDEDGAAEERQAPHP